MAKSRYSEKMLYHDWIDDVILTYEEIGAFSMVYRMYEHSATKSTLWQDPEVRYIGKSNLPTKRYNNKILEGEIRDILVPYHSRKDFSVGRVEYCIITGDLRKIECAAEECRQYHIYKELGTIYNSSHPPRPPGGCPVCDR